MLTPEYLAHCADDIIKLYQQLEDDIICDIVRRLVNTDFQMTQSAVWQAEKLQQAGVVYEDVIKRVAQITGKSEAELEQLFSEGGTQTLRYDDSIYRKAGLHPLPVKQSPAMLAMLRAGYEKCGQTLHNLTLTIANTSQTAYIQACDRAYMQVTSGAFDYNTAIRRAVEELSQAGSYILYPSGHRDRIDVAVRRAVVTGVSQTCGQLQMARMDEMGCDLVETTAHMGARPSHAEWQGRVFSRSGQGKYPEFEASTGYGSGDGLMGWNCRHNFYPFFEGISTRAYSDDELRELTEHTVTYDGVQYSDYEASQLQRKMERGIRDSKRTLTGLDAAQAAADETLARGLREEFQARSVKLKQQEARLSDFLAQTGRGEERARVQVAGFGRSTAQKAVQAEKKALQNITKRDIINKKKVENVKSGAFYGALNPENDKDFKRCEEHARKYYEEIRKRTTDISSISKNTGMDEEVIRAVKQHIFVNKYDLGEEQPTSFYPSYDIAVSWQNLIDGKNIEEKDLVLIKHEYYEYNLMKNEAMEYVEAHGEAQKLYNYKKAVDDWRAKQ